MTFSNSRLSDHCTTLVSFDLFAFPFPINFDHFPLYFPATAGLSLLWVVSLSSLSLLIVVFLVSSFELHVVHRQAMKSKELEIGVGTMGILQLWKGSPELCWKSGQWIIDTPSECSHPISSSEGVEQARLVPSL